MVVIWTCTVFTSANADTTSFLLLFIRNLHTENDFSNTKITHNQIEEQFVIAKNKEKDMRKIGKLEDEFKALYGADVIQK